MSLLLADMQGKCGKVQYCTRLHDMRACSMQLRCWASMRVLAEYAGTP